MLDLLTGFVTELRNAGLPVSLTESIDAMQAVKEIPLEDREDFKFALAATMVKSASHWRAFETVFEVYFSTRLAPPEGGDGNGALDEAALEMLREMQQNGEQAGGGRGRLPPRQRAG